MSNTWTSEQVRLFIHSLEAEAEESGCECCEKLAIAAEKAVSGLQALEDEYFSIRAVLRELLITADPNYAAFCEEGVSLERFKQARESARESLGAL